MGVNKFLNVSIILNVLVDSELVRDTSNAQDGILVPSAGLNNSHQAAGLHDISIGYGNKCLVGGLRISHKSSNSPPEVEL